MEETPLQLLNAFPNKTILVLGDVILDSYLEGGSTRLCREAPVPIVDILDEKRYPGGAANTAVNVAAMGAKCLLFSIIGKDPEGDDLLKVLRDKGVDTYNVLGVAARRTLFKQRIVADGQMLVRVDKGSTHTPTTEAEIGLLVNFLDQSYKHGTSRGSLDAIIISDYGYGTMAPPILAKLQELHTKFHYPIIIDAKDLTKYSELNATAMTPNYAEAVSLLGEPILPVGAKRREQILTFGSSLLHELNTQILVVTLDQDGAAIFERGALPNYIPTVARKGTVGGAGDTFISAFTLALCAGGSASTAAQMGVEAATAAVSLPGTATCTYERLYRAFQNKQNAKFLTRCELDSVLDDYRLKGAKIVFTNGCFDLLHHGHIQHLREAAAQGDILVVGVNTDESVKALKGESRPINPFRDRVALLSALSFVDFVTPLLEDNPIELIKEVRPDVFVKGGDYARETLPEAAVVEELGGEVKILPFHAGYSTSSLIEKIKEPAHDYVGQSG
jgi:D-beta-D-heptose 7-phosphate kinase/D-beta-D-heptose 1-phosphate adenosyltransferase